MTPDDQPNKDLQRARKIIAAAVEALHPLDYQDRVAWCQEHDQHGVQMLNDDNDDIVEFRWGGRTLALVHRDALLTDALFRFDITEMPNVVPDSLAAAPVTRRPDDDERDLIKWLAVQAVAEKYDLTNKQAADMLDDLADQGLVVFRGDNYEAWLDVGDVTVVRCTREWLDQNAHIDPDDGEI